MNNEDHIYVYIKFIYDRVKINILNSPFRSQMNLAHFHHKKNKQMSLAWMSQLLNLSNAHFYLDFLVTRR